MRGEYPERSICDSYPRIMAVTVESAFVVSTMRTVSFTWNIIFHIFRGTGITSMEDVTVERHTDKESYAGVCDDVRSRRDYDLLSAESW